MKHVRLGRTGLQVTPLCLGMMTYGDPDWRPWILGEDTARPLVQTAVEAGIRFFDTANTYSAGVSEIVTGKLLRDMLPREEYVLATKVYFAVGPEKPNNKGLSRKHILSAIDESLKRLQMDYVDLYQIHRWDYETPIEETMEALHDVVKAGKARYIGASSMFAWQFAKAQSAADAHGWTRFVSMQNHYNLLYREEEREMNPLCADQGVGLIPWSPLARGRLARAAGAETARSACDDFATRLYDGADTETVRRVAQVAGEIGASPAGVSLAWHWAKGVASPIIGASKPGQLEDAVKALEVSLTPEQIAFIEEPYLPRPILGHS